MLTDEMFSSAFHRLKLWAHELLPVWLVLALKPEAYRLKNVEAKKSIGAVL
ncbi:MAG: hypothetical protein IPP19_05525 [Verrucomicrobia bacterium]|nr:hypothetical protein [Verrucomicrobiota bacterium]